MTVNLTSNALLFTIAAIGISEAAYLIRKRIAAENPVCPIGENCATVLNSKYNRLFFGIHNDIAGLIFYLLFAFIAGIIVIGTPYSIVLITAAQILLAGATAMSIALTYLQWRVIKAWCFWCVMSAVTIVLMDIIVFIIKFT